MWLFNVVVDVDVDVDGGGVGGVLCVVCCVLCVVCCVLCVVVVRTTLDSKFTSTSVGYPWASLVTN